VKEVRLKGLQVVKCGPNLVPVALHLLLGVTRRVQLFTLFPPDFGEEVDHVLVTQGLQEQHCLNFVLEGKEVS